MWPIEREHDACALIANVRKTALPSHGNIKRTIEALVKMGHRSGVVEGEGDGCGLLVDIPRQIWTQKLARAGLNGGVTKDARFVVGHAFIAPEERAQSAALKAAVLERFARSGVEVVYAQAGGVDHTALGRRGQLEEPEFWQVAGVFPDTAPSLMNGRLFELQLEVERDYPVHFCSLSSSAAVYKVRGTAEVLEHYYPEIRLPEFMSAVAIGHNRYSTNTASSFLRVQPFSLLGHNGEINTIARLREQTRLLGIPLVPGGSDSQDLDRALAGLTHRFGLGLIEAMEILFPPIIGEIKHYPADLQDLCVHLRQAWGPFAQGPAALVTRYGDECVFSVDALGLRPLWSGETDKEFFWSSEKGAIPLETMVRDPKPMAPGEKMAALIDRGRGVTVLEYTEVQQEVLARMARRLHVPHRARLHLACGGPADGRPGAPAEDVQGVRGEDGDRSARLLAAHAWDFEDVQLTEALAARGSETIGSLGFDGPLAALARERHNIADYFKECVAVVTNPAIDREREIEHFSTRCVVGRRPPLDRPADPKSVRVELLVPILLTGADHRSLARELGTWLYEDLRAHYQAPVLTMARRAGETVPQGLDRLAGEAMAASRAGAQLVALDGEGAFADDLRPIDPLLAVAAVDQALRSEGVALENLRRRTSLIVRSGAVRNLHDLALLVGFGADAVCPDLMLSVAGPEAARRRNLFVGLQKGLEKVISTMGIHELRGYGRLASSIGLQPAVADVFEAPNYFGAQGRGLAWEALEQEGEERWAIARGLREGRPVRTFHLYPRVWKAASSAASHPQRYPEYEEKVAGLEAENPISLRHCLELRSPYAPCDPDAVDTGVGRHAYPFEISSMSFGSQGETAFRAYAEAAYRLNIVCLNGEGGEIKDMLGKYPWNRGQQVASGRFGVNIQLCNSANLLEIKIGQGAKPGEGGHLPGTKVSVKVAAARNARPGVDLISPSNNHDIYSIEDLAQIVEELKTANPHARVSVKVPVVPGIGTIAVGIAKAGADIVTLSGYDGGTGAARKHALRHVGLPVEIGVRLAHRALVEAGLRQRVEVWADGGVKTSADVAKLLCLGANRCGFGTLAMVAIGCTICHGCQLDTCHVGIATQMETMEEALQKGVKRFEAREFEAAVENLCRFFRAMGEELRILTGRLGFRRTQDMVGRTDLLVQVCGQDRVDLEDLLAPVPGEHPAHGREPGAIRPVHRPRNFLTQLVAHQALAVIDQGEERVLYEDDKITAADRAMGTYLAGEIVRGRFGGKYVQFREARLALNGGSIPGNGLAAFTGDGLSVVVEGGGQDGIGKGAFGGRTVILKGSNHQGVRLDGSVGKGLAYGAQRGLFLVQGDADSRAGVRLSGADIVIGGELRGPLQDHLGSIASRANVKGFAFEYMTAGRAVVLGDPGPWICSGMTGGVVYLRLQPEMGLDEAALHARLAKGALVELLPLDASDVSQVRELLTPYRDELLASYQEGVAERVGELMRDAERHFRKVQPRNLQEDQSVSTE